MTKKLFIALYFGLFASMIGLFFINSPGAFVFFCFLFLAVFGGLLLADLPSLIVLGFLVASVIVLGIGLFTNHKLMQSNYYAQFNLSLNYMKLKWRWKLL